MKKLVRTDTDRKLAGICGGIARYMNIDSAIVRIIMIVLAITTGILPFVIGYVIAIYVIPNEQDIVE